MTTSTRELVATARTLPRPGSVVLVAAAVLFTVALRLPFLTRPLTPDEAGLLIIAQNWSEGRFLYGDYFVGRGIVLMLYYLVADALGGAIGVRVLACVVAAVTVAAAGWAGHQLRGRAGAGWAALLAASYSSTYAFSAEGMNGRLLGATFVMVSVAVTLDARRHPRSLARPVVAGVFATLPLLVVQSYADGLLFALVLLVGSVLTRALPSREALRIAAGGLLGVMLTVAALLLVMATTWMTVSQLWFQLYGARMQASLVVGESTAMPTQRLAMLATLTVLTGVLLVLGSLLGGLREVRRHPDRLPVWWAAVAMVALSWVSMVAGGDFWPDYLLQLIPALALAVGLVAASATWSGIGMRVAAVVAAAAAVVAVYFGIERPVLGTPTNEAAVGEWLADSAEPGDDATVLWGKANVLHHADMTSPYPYLWSLLIRTLDPELDELTAVLEGPDAPTWLVEWHDTDAWGLDPDGSLAELIAERYAFIGSPCGVDVYLLRGEERDLQVSDVCVPFD